MAAAKKIDKAVQRRPSAKALLKSWERNFRADFAREGGARFEALIQRFGIRTNAPEMLEGTVDFVTACAAFASTGGLDIGALLGDQSYDGQSANYALTFDLFGRSSARLLVQPDMKSIDLADLFEYPWDRLGVVGYENFWISRLDGEDLSIEEIEALRRAVCNDIWFDYGEDEVSIIFDPDTCAGALSVTVYERSEDTSDTEAPRS